MQVRRQGTLRSFCLQSSKENTRKEGTNCAYVRCSQQCFSARQHKIIQMPSNAESIQCDQETHTVAVCRKT